MFPRGWQSLNIVKMEQTSPLLVYDLSHRERGYILAS